VNKQYLDLMLHRKTFNYLNVNAQENLNINTRQLANLSFPTLPEHCATNEYVDRMFNRLRSDMLSRAATSQPDESTSSTTE